MFAKVFNSFISLPSVLKIRQDVNCMLLFPTLGGLGECVSKVVIWVASDNLVQLRDDSNTSSRTTVMPPVEKFKYLSSIIQQNGDINKDINQCIQVGWHKWKYASSVLCDKRMSVGLKGKVYHLVVRPAVLYESEC